MSSRARPSFASMVDMTGAEAMNPSAYATKSSETTEYDTLYCDSIDGRTAPV